MPSYKLTYFEGKGRAELCRLLFAYKGVNYEDERLTKEAWAERKPNTTFGQLPELTVDGSVIAQSNTMGRYLARQFGLAGKTPIEEAQADAIIDFFEDMFRPLVFAYTAPEDQKEAPRKKFKEEDLPLSLAKLEKVLISNKGGDGYFVGDSLTWADIAFLNISTWPSSVQAEVNWDPVPKLKALRDKVAEIPKIAEWIKIRPKTDM